MMYALADITADLGRSPVYVRGLQDRFALPVWTGADYSRPYLIFLRQLVYLRVLDIPEKNMLKLWHLEKKLLVLLNADTESSPTWFLDQCGKRSRPRRRLLLSNYDTGTDLFLRILQPGLPMRVQETELFKGDEMGENVVRVLHDYLNEYEGMRKRADQQIKLIRAAATWANRLPQKMG